MPSSLTKLLLAIQLITVSVLPTGCVSTGPKDEPMQVTAARREAQLRGWKRIEIGRCTFRDGFWFVEVFKKPNPGAANYASVKISPDGTVVDFWVNPR